MINARPRSSVAPSGLNEKEFVQVTIDLKDVIVLDGVDPLHDQQSYRIRSHDLYGPLPAIEIEDTGDRLKVVDDVHNEAAKLSAIHGLRKELLEMFEDATRNAPQIPKCPSSRAKGARTPRVLRSLSTSDQLKEKQAALVKLPPLDSSVATQPEAGFRLRRDVLNALGVDLDLAVIRCGHHHLDLVTLVALERLRIRDHVDIALAVDQHEVGAVAGTFLDTRNGGIGMVGVFVLAVRIGDVSGNGIAGDRGSGEHKGRGGEQK